jgi:type IV pilus assembly protein PilA
VIVVAMIGVLASIVVPGLLRARLSANEASAVASLNALVSAEVAYSSACGNNGYATAFATLGVPPPGSQDPFLPPDLTGAVSPQQSGYRYDLRPGAGATRGPLDCNGTVAWTGYYATAVPTRPGVSGARAFAASAKGAIWQETAHQGAAAPVEPFAVTATVTPVE